MLYICIFEVLKTQTILYIMNLISKVSSISLCSFLILLTSCQTPAPNGNDTPKAEAEAIDALPTDTLLFSFVFVGCNRIDRHDKGKAGTNASTANVPELKRTFQEVTQLDPQPNYFFFLGDLVLGLKEDSLVLTNELGNWVNQYNDSSFSGISSASTEMIAIPGNHEMLYYSDDLGSEIPYSNASFIWQNEMSSFMPQGVSINKISSDSLNNLQTYSFNYLNTHFILMNTDTYNSDSLIGQIPANWIKQDIENTRTDSAIEHIFLLGHKPAYVDAPRGAPDETIDTALVSVIWPAMESNQVEAMLSAHSHQYYREQPTGQSYQIIAGNGGSPYVKDLDIDHQFFGYTHISVMSSGKIILKSMGRNIPATNYLEAIPDSVHTTVKDSIDISWGTTAPIWPTGTN